MLAWILRWVAYVRWGIVALVGIVAMVLSSVDAGSWPFWVVLAVVIGLVFFFWRGLWRIFTGGWRIALFLGVLFLMWVLLFRALPVVMAVASSWWGSAKTSVASLTAGQQAPNVDMTTPTLPTSQIVQTTPVVPASQPVVVQCPPGLVCIPAQAVATQQATVATSSAVQSSPKVGGRSLDELMREGSSREALAQSRRLSGDGQ